MCCFFKLVIFFCGFSAKVTCAFLANKKQFGEFNRIKHIFDQIKVSMVLLSVNQALPSLHAGTLEITLIVLTDLSIFFYNKTSRSYFYNFNNFFLDKGCGHKLTHTNKNEISINLFPVCYQSLPIILFCLRSVLF